MSATTTTTKMYYVRLGNTGLKVSRICLGCMSYGNSKWSPWVKDEAEAVADIKEAYNLGINFFDTANTYSNGDSEKILGKALKELNAPRSRVVIATKVFGPVYDDTGKSDRSTLQTDPDMINRFGLSRKHIFDAVDASLERLGVNYIDLYQIHRFDPNTPIEETMEALNDLVRSGKVRYIGASSMATWQFAKMNHVAEKRGWAQFVSMQNLYNLLYREEEREMAPYCSDSGIAWIPWSPLAMGQLTGKKRETTRSGSRFVMSMFPTTQAESNNTIIDRVEELAKKYNATCAQIALAWEFTKPYVSSPIVGVSKIEQLYDLVGSLDIKLTEEDVKYLEEPYTPRGLVY
ncbi:NADP-dependent oxidoreductase domain-containing protein [Gilbertella persicaria]|uniref:NADP-dependent oxidoreductase domain-containing protein n=1 Tax=Gilbertella persicaria TaxID=101096 RepID=UPI002220B640|nr:NADP-dependent oxidoreductase domain-containing protein [Gilbertella persicaria]KAI8066952.1 NADP-dependent oxidoreductase domain-containing protein [Gilbertella persicaria]